MKSILIYNRGVIAFKFVYRRQCNAFDAICIVCRILHRKNACRLQYNWHLLERVLDQLFSQIKITGSGQKFERTTVWTMVWRWSDQSSFWSEESDHRRIRAHLGLIITSSSALVSDQKCFRTQLGLIRDHFEPLFLFSFFVIFLL